MRFFGGGTMEYDVFLSFTGVDTRSGFLSHLYEGLTNKGIYTFKDDITLAKGKKIWEILESISRSKISLVVLSENYANSRFCLTELEYIIRSADPREQGQIVVPIFYKVDRSDVKNLGGSFARAFEKHEKTKDKEKVERWKEALSKLASIPGWDLRRFRNEAALIEAVVGYVLDKLVCAPSADACSQNVSLQSMPSISFSRKLKQTSSGYLNPANVTMADLSCILFARILFARIPALSIAQHLVSLSLQHCIDLVDLSSIQSPTMLKTLDLSECSNLKKHPLLSTKIESLYLAGTSVEGLPQSVGNASGLVNLDLRKCSRLMTLPSGIHRLNRLEIVNVAGCSNVLKLLGRIGKGKQPNQEGNGTRENGQKKMEESILIVEGLKKCKKLKGSARLRENPSIQSDGSASSDLRSLPRWSIPEVVADLYTHEELNVDRRLFFFATSLFEQEAKREIYMSLRNADDKIEWLKFHHGPEQAKGDI